MKIKIPKNNQKGITIITLVIVIILLLIITGILVYNSTTAANLRKLKRMYSDIDTLSEKVNTYYAKYSTIPGNIEVLGIDKEKMGMNKDDKIYVLELSYLSGVSLNYGKDYDKVTKDNEYNNEKDLYIISEETHSIYYLNGIEYDKKTYYTNN